MNDTPLESNVDFAIRRWTLSSLGPTFLRSWSLGPVSRSRCKIEPSEARRGNTSGWLKMEHLPSRKHTKAIENGHLISLNAIEIVDLPTKNGDVPSVFVNVHQRVEDLNGLAAPGILTTHPLPKNKNIPSPRCLGCNIFLNKNGQKSFPDTKKKPWANLLLSWGSSCRHPVGPRPWRAVEVWSGRLGDPWQGFIPWSNLAMQSPNPCRMFSSVPASMDWFKGKSTGNHRFSYEIWGFSIIFPLNQSIDCNIPTIQQSPNSPHGSMDCTAWIR